MYLPRTRKELTAWVLEHTGTDSFCSMYLDYCRNHEYSQFLDAKQALNDWIAFIHKEFPEHVKVNRHQRFNGVTVFVCNIRVKSFTSDWELDWCKRYLGPTWKWEGSYVPSEN